MVAKRSSGRQRVTTFGRQGPQAGPARDQKSRKRPVGKRQTGQRERRQVEKWNGKEGKKERKRDLTRLLGQRPGEFIARRAYRQASTSENIRVFASDGGGLLEHSI